LPLLHVKVHVLPEQPAVARAGAGGQQLVPQRLFEQLMSQPEAVQTAAPSLAGGVQRLPQLKQFDVSVERFTQLVPHRVCPVLQRGRHVPSSHT
jgi:hypothetical protein